MRKFLVIFVLLLILPCYAGNDLQDELPKIAKAIYQDWVLYNENPEAITFYSYLLHRKTEYCASNNYLNCKYAKLIIERYHELLNMGYKYKTPTEEEINAYLNTMTKISKKDYEKLDKGFKPSINIYFKTF